ncbi:hypothetical protein [Cellulosimicrobium composti]|uniref:hypothetical protein n=1 Tax=Cellulosimicrobium composti TaxID=2672572 RepID=UPI00378A3938
MHAHHLAEHAGLDPSTQATTGPSDAELADAVRAGDTDAYAHLWERHATAGRAAARQITASFDPDHLLQEAFTLSRVRLCGRARCLRA